MKEVWRPVVGFEGSYSISNLGNVWSLLSSKQMIPSNEVKPRVQLVRNGKRKQFFVSELVAVAFLDKTLEYGKFSCVHKDGNGSNNAAINIKASPYVISSRVNTMYTPKAENIYKISCFHESYFEKKYEDLKHSSEEEIDRLTKEIERLKDENSTLLRMFSDVGVKQCGSCKEIKIISEFSSCASENDGLNRECKSCYNSRMAAYVKRKRKKDTLFNLSFNIRQSISASLRKRGYTKKSKTHEILGCGFKELITHLNNNPYGFRYGNPGLDIDHIIPISTAKTKEDVIRLNHHTNLQLLPSSYNRHIKKDKKFNRHNFEEWARRRNLIV